ncbi:Holliday junction branch migration protein RuvA [Nakamurella deserti]|uniref:Holliday junction branch migration protein RuvA n=1 Tax=Nakamurella deserti TaxID=2164074 RepID=UPI000DBE52E6|nr:Holliday junction branch migration protein RuvA [Nakamurella deserti]
MIASVRGAVLSIALDRVVVEVGGVGLAVRATPATLATLTRGQDAYLATTLVVREDSLTLFGFGSDEARDLFELVQSVTGVGPKIALALLAVFTPDELRQALGSGDVTALTRAPGIGRKGAERLVLELRDKVGVLPGTGARPAAGPTVLWRDKLVEALTGLGWTAKQAGDTVDTLAEDVHDPAVRNGDVGVLLRRALALLGGKR